MVLTKRSAKAFALGAPLFGFQNKARWGYVDLFGLTAGGEPVIVELKTGESTDTPLHALLEASTYATVLRRNWNQVAKELRDLLVSQGRPSEISEGLDEPPNSWRLILLAPPAYWEGFVKGVTRHDPVREAYGELLDSLAAKGMVVQHADVAGVDGWDGRTALDPNGLGIVASQRWPGLTAG